MATPTNGKVNNWATVLGGIGVFMLSWCLNDATTGARQSSELRQHGIEIRALRAKTDNMPEDLGKRLRSIEITLGQIKSMVENKK